MLRGIVPVAGEASQGAHSRRGLDAAVQLSHRYLAGPATARQSGQRAGHGLRAAGAGPERDSARDRRLPRGSSMIWRYRTRFWSAKRPWAPITASGWQKSRSRRAEVEARLADLRDALGEGTRSGQPRSARSATQLEGATARARRASPRRSDGRRHGGDLPTAAPILRRNARKNSPAIATAELSERRCRANRRLMRVCGRCADRRRSHLGLDRHSGRQDDEG